MILRRKRAIARNMDMLSQAKPDAMIRVRLTGPGTHKTFYKSGRLTSPPPSTAETIVLQTKDGGTREYDLGEVTVSFVDEKDRTDRLQFDNA